MKIIGLAGIARAGKTVGANAIAEALFKEGFTPHIDHFAAPLKQSAALLGFDKGGAYDKQYRYFCQTIGTDWIRNWDPHWWVKLMESRLMKVAEQEQVRLNDGDHPWHESVVIIDDIRFQNEIDLVRRNNGRMIFVSAARRMTDLSADWRQHESEHLATAYEQGQLPDSLFDYTISNNDGTQESYQKSIAALGVQIATTAREEMH